MDPFLIKLALVTFIVCLGSVLQASTGFGVGLIIVPLLALVDLSFIPGPIIFGSIVLSLLMTIAGRHYIDTRHLAWLVAGLVIGATLGAQVLTFLPARLAGLLFGSLIILAVVLSYLRLRLRFTHSVLVGSGLVSGFMGITAAIGAPVLALLYQYHEGRQLRATLAFLYFLSAMMMVLLLYLHQQFGKQDIIQGLMLMPGFVLGFLLGSPVAKWLDRGYTRPAVLIIATASAVYLILKSITIYAS